MSQADYLQRFIFEHHAIRGEFVFLNHVFQTITNQRNYPSPVKQLLGEAIAATALLSATIKYEGSLILQAQSSGPINLIVAQADQDLNLRALAKWQDDADFSKSLMGEGRLIITISPNNTTEHYQGIVDITTDQLNLNLENYFAHSEQLPTKLWLSANQHQAVGLLLQKMPNTHQGEQAAGTEWESWENLKMSSDTITQHELLSLDPVEILSRLFHEEDIRIFKKIPIHFKCTCNKNKMLQALKILDKTELDDLFKNQSFIEVSCEFCNTCYAFNRKDVETLF
jgi:molecular chaperone Hsp33